ncbi:MAG: hypothetical protein WCJ30_08190 [Deltaproteobacteria bacterium]
MDEALAGGTHALAQDPQWLGSVWRFTQLDPQRMALPEQPLEQTRPPATLLQTGMPALHVTPHAPQLVGSDRSASHPFDAWPSQSANPAEHV